MQAGLQAMPRCKLACKLCRGAAYLMQRYKKHKITTTFKQKTCRNINFFSRLRQILMISYFFLLFYLSTTFTPAGMNERRLIMPTATTKMRQLSQQKHANCHNENAPTATTKTRQLPQQVTKITRFN